MRDGTLRFNEIKLIISFVIHFLQISSATANAYAAYHNVVLFRLYDCRVATSNTKYEPIDCVRMSHILSSDYSPCTVPSKANAISTSHAASQRALSRGLIHSVWENFMMLHVSLFHHSRAVILVLILHSTAYFYTIISQI